MIPSVFLLQEMLYVEEIRRESSVASLRREADMMGTLSGSALGDQGRRQARAASSVARASDTRGAPSSVFPGGEGRGGARGGGAGGSPYYASFLFFSLRKRVVFISPTTILRLSYTKGLHIQNTHEVPAFILLSRARRIFLRSFVSSLCRSSLLFSAYLQHCRHRSRCPK